MKTKAIYAGSFNPIHIGHIDIIKRASNLFDLTVLIADNPNKENSTTYESLDMIRTILSELKIKADVDYTCDFLADYCKKNAINVIVKGLRNGNDLDSEMNQEWYTKHFNSDIETIYLSTDEKYRNISSSAIKSLVGYDEKSFRERFEKICYLPLKKTTYKKYLEYIRDCKYGL